jgi:prepilin-type N-terminal cleavage/methylation domain-containing protein
MTKQFSSEKGFTLVEVLTSIFIILLLSTMVFVMNRQTNKQFALLRSANKLAQDIRRAQQMAMTTSACPGGISCKGYGIYLITGSLNYVLYADVDAGLGFGNEYHDAGDADDPIDLESGVSIKSVTPSPLSINFKPPDPTTKISSNGVEPFSGQGEIILELSSDPSKTKTVRVNKSGLIWVE